MSLSSQLTSEQLKEIIEYEKNTDKSARKVQKHVEDGQEVLDPENTCSVRNTVLTTANKKFGYECLDEAVRLLNARPICQLPDDHIPDCRYSISGLPGTKFMVHQVCAIRIIVRRWVWNADMPGALVVDEMGVGKTFTSVAVAMLFKLVTEKVVMGLPLSILWGKTLEKWVILAHKDFPGIVGEEWEWYPLQRMNSVPHCQMQIQSTPPHGHPALISAREPMLVVTMPGVAVYFKSVINVMTYGTDFKYVNLLHSKNANPTQENLNTSIQ